MADIDKLIDAHLDVDANPDPTRRAAVVQRTQIDPHGHLAQVTGVFGPVPALETAS